jgi:trigger factor
VLARLDIPLPERLVEAETRRRRESLDEQLERSGATMESLLQAQGVTEEEFDAQTVVDARRRVKTGFVLDELARAEDLRVEQRELNAYLVEQAYRLGVPPERLAKEIVDRGQLGVAAAEVLRDKALTLLAERVTVTDAAGHPVDVKAIPEEARGDDGAPGGGDGAPAGGDGAPGGGDGAPAGEAGEAGAEGGEAGAEPAAE